MRKELKSPILVLLVPTIGRLSRKYKHCFLVIQQTRVDARVSEIRLSQVRFTAFRVEVFDEHADAMSILSTVHGKCSRSGKQWPLTGDILQFPGMYKINVDITTLRQISSQVEDGISTKLNPFGLYLLTNGKKIFIPR